MNRKIFNFATSVAFSASVLGLSASPVRSADAGHDAAKAEAEIRTLYKQLIDDENAHDIAAVRRMVWKSPSALFVAKTKTAAEGNWAGFWGKEVVVEHLHELFAGAFRIDPDYSKERIAFLSPTVAETYVPVDISVAYAGQSGTPKPFLMIIEWVRVPSGTWKMATDIALPIPVPPK
jgi:hypothetical protein